MEKTAEEAQAPAVGLVTFPSLILRALFIFSLKERGQIGRRAPAGKIAARAHPPLARWAGARREGPHPVQRGWSESLARQRIRIQTSRIMSVAFRCKIGSFSLVFFGLNYRGCCPFFARGATRRARRGKMSRKCRADTIL